MTGIEWPGEGASPSKALAQRLKLSPDRLASVELVKKSLDARQRRKRWVANYRVELTGDEASVLARGLRGVRAWTARDDARYGRLDPLARAGTWPAGVRPVVIGAGPAGLFAALRLAEAGAPVTLIERGAPVEERIKTVNRFWRGATLDPESNVVYGEGGAGTFSDGKIYTRRRDGELGYIFQRLVDFGADPDIRTSAWAHLGTDRVRKILPVFRARLRELGAEVRFGVAVTGFIVEGGACVGVQLSDGSELRRAPVIVAAGHSARDTYLAMLEAGARAVQRPTSIGARIEHPQDLIDQARYGGERGELPPASYRLAHTPEGGRGAHTFCMCPGGLVVPATNHTGRVVVNGMSFSSQRAFWANSAVIAHVDPSEYPGEDPMAGVRYQDAIEQRAFALGGQSYAAPAQRVEDLLQGRVSAELPRVSFPQGVVPADLREVLSGALVDAMIEALRVFDSKLPGFAGPDAVLIAPETRTTAPLRFLRDDALESEGLPGLLPVGEGAGYAGGIISAALDGLRAAESLVVRLAPRES